MQLGTEAKRCPQAALRAMTEWELNWIPGRKERSFEPADETKDTERLREDTNDGIGAKPSCKRPGYDSEHRDDAGIPGGGSELAV